MGIIRHIFSVLFLIIAMITGIYAQDISFYLNTKFSKMEFTTIIAIVTFISVFLFIIIPIMLLGSKNVSQKTAINYLLVSGLLGIPISIWSLFVLAMWRG